MNIKYFWVVFNRDLFIVPMYNLAGHIVNFIYFNKSSKWGSRYFGKNFRFSDISTFLPFFNEKQIHYLHNYQCRHVLFAFYPFWGIKEAIQYEFYKWNKRYTRYFIQKIVEINIMPLRNGNFHYNF